jgi:hypothetical protein
LSSSTPDYWDKTWLPRLHRIVFDRTLEQREAVELVKTSEGRVSNSNFSYAVA